MVEGGGVPDAVRGAVALTEGEGETAGLDEPLRESSGDTVPVPHMEPLDVLEGKGDAVSGDAVPQPLYEREGGALAVAGPLLSEAGAVPEGRAVAALLPVLDGEAVSTPVAVCGPLGVPCGGEGDDGADAEAQPEALCELLPLALSLAHAVAVGAPPLREPPAVAVGASPVALESGEKEGPPLPVSAPVPEPSAVPLPDGEAGGLFEGGEDRVGNGVPVAIEKEGAPLPDVRPVGAPLLLGKADTWPDAVGAREALGVPLCAPLVGVVAALCVWGSDARADAVAQGEAKTLPDAVRVGDGVLERAAECEEPPLFDTEEVDESHAVTLDDAVAQNVAPSLPLCVCDAQALPVGVGDTDAPVVGEALCEAEGVLTADPVENGDAEASKEPESTRENEARSEMVKGALPLALPLPSALPDAVAHGVSETAVETEGEDDTVPLPVAECDAVLHADAVPQLLADREGVGVPLLQLLTLPLADTRLEALTVAMPLRVLAAVCEAGAGVAEGGALALPRKETEGEGESLRLLDAQGDALALLLPEEVPLLQGEAGGGAVPVVEPLAQALGVPPNKPLPDAEEVLLPLVEPLKETL